MAGTMARTRLTIATPDLLSVPSDDGRLRATFNVDARRCSDGVHAAQVTFRMRRGPNKPPSGFDKIIILVNETKIKEIEHLGGYIPPRERWDTHHVSFLANKSANLVDGTNKITFELVLTGKQEATDKEWFEIEDVTLLFHAKHES